MSLRMKFKNFVSPPIFLKSLFDRTLSVQPSIQTAWQVTCRGIAKLVADDVRNAWLSPRIEKVSSYSITWGRSVISKIMEAQA